MTLDVSEEKIPNHWKLNHCELNYIRAKSVWTLIFNIYQHPDASAVYGWTVYQ